ncbi:restriction endonuclease subunit S [Bacillus sonorensis]|uniref:restriction endonuclease subunit S n=1 Tax=Bacillus sonorensis TaxID=119858 RepID=UPI000496A648|nr:restriction endonuclease subunit S [Bacillus sonorensis]MEC1502347.1 restriction endonuclease subunit S [Bacillus sonorensis]MEC1589672.1 restriction endonuclease subunit S [Bacillus sonorensis]
MENKRSPEIRFLGFTGEWEQRKIGDHAEILTGGTPKTQIKEYWEPSEIPWMSSGEVNKKRLSSTDNMISILGFKNSSARWVKENSILIALAGQGKTRGTVAINEIPLTTNQSIAAIVPKEELHYEFVFQSLEKRYEELRLISSGDGTRGGLNKQLVADVVIISPSIAEQFKIGNFFKQLDDMIALHQKELTTLKQTKQGFLQKMFPKEGESVPEVRFPGFTGDWEECKLGDIGKFKNGMNFDKNAMEHGHPFVNLQDIFGRNIVDNSNLGFAESSENQRKEYNLKKGDILFIRSSVKPEGVGEAALVPKDLKDTTYSGFIIRFRPTIEMDNQFKRFIFGTKSIRKQILSHSTSSANTNINQKALEKIKIKIPLCEEQKEIGGFFRNLDNTIALHQRELDALKETKKAFLQKMFV